MIRLTSKSGAAPIDDLTNRQLWFVSYPDGKLNRVTNDLTDYQLCCLDVTQDGKTLVDTETTTSMDLWTTKAGRAQPIQIVSDKENANCGLSWMPDGRIAYIDQDGKLFSINPDGSNRILLLADGHPKWWPSACGDGRFIVFASYRDEKVGVWRVNVDGSGLTRIGDESLANFPQCSPDGLSVVYRKMESGATAMRVPITGAGSPTPLGHDPAFSGAAISPDGKMVTYLSFGNLTKLSLRVMSIGNWALLHDFDVPGSIGDFRWAPGGAAVQYVLTRGGVSNIREQKLTGGPPKQITNFKAGRISHFDWSRDGKQLAFSRGTSKSDVVMISNFR